MPENGHTSSATPLVCGIESVQSGVELVCFIVLRLTSATYQLKIHLALPCAQGSSQTVGCFLFQCSCSTHSFRLFLRAWARRSLSLFLTHSHTFDTCLLVLTGLQWWQGRNILYYSGLAIASTIIASLSIPGIKNQAFLLRLFLSLFSVPSPKRLFYLSSYPKKVFCPSIFRFCSVREKNQGLKPQPKQKLLPSSGLYLKSLSSLVLSLSYKYQ